MYPHANFLRVGPGVASLLSSFQLRLTLNHNVAGSCGLPWIQAIGGPRKTHRSWRVGLHLASCAVCVAEG